MRHSSRLTETKREWQGGGTPQESYPFLEEAMRKSQRKSSFSATIGRSRYAGRENQRTCGARSRLFYSTPGRENGTSRWNASESSVAERVRPQSCGSSSSRQSFNSRYFKRDNPMAEGTRPRAFSSRSRISHTPSRTKTRESNSLDSVRPWSSTCKRRRGPDYYPKSIHPTSFGKSFNSNRSHCSAQSAYNRGKDCGGRMQSSYPVNYRSRTFDLPPSRPAEHHHCNCECRRRTIMCKEAGVNTELSLINDMTHCAKTYPSVMYPSNTLADSRKQCSNQQTPRQTTFTRTLTSPITTFVSPTRTTMPFSQQQPTQIGCNCMPASSQDRSCNTANSVQFSQQPYPNSDCNCISPCSQGVTTTFRSQTGNTTQVPRQAYPQHGYNSICPCFQNKCVNTLFPPPTGNSTYLTQKPLIQTGQNRMLPNPQNRRFRVSFIPPTANTTQLPQQNYTQNGYNGICPCQQGNCPDTAVRSPVGNSTLFSRQPLTQNGYNSTSQYGQNACCDSLFRSSTENITQMPQQPVAGNDYKGICTCQQGNSADTSFRSPRENTTQFRHQPCPQNNYNSKPGYAQNMSFANSPFRSPRGNTTQFHQQPCQHNEFKATAPCNHFPQQNSQPFDTKAQVNYCSELPNMYTAECAGDEAPAKNSENCSRLSLTSFLDGAKSLFGYKNEPEEQRNEISLQPGPQQQVAAVPGNQHMLRFQMTENPSTVTCAKPGLDGASRYPTSPPSLRSPCVAFSKNTDQADSYGQAADYLGKQSAAPAVHMSQDSEQQPVSTNQSAHHSYDCHSSYARAQQSNLWTD